MKRCLSIILITVLLITCCVGCGGKKDSSGMKQEFFTLEDIKKPGVNLGILTGSVFDQIAEEMLPDANIEYYETYADMAYLVSIGELDAFLTDQPLAAYITSEYPSVDYLDEYLLDDEYSLAFSKDEEGLALSESFSEYIRRLRENGTLTEMASRWFDTKYNGSQLNYTGDAESSEFLSVIIKAEVAPFSFVQDGIIVGFIPELISGYCLEHGLSCTFDIGNLSSVLAGASSGKYDIGAAPLSITEERKKSVNFCESYYNGGAVAVVYTGEPEVKEITAVEELNDSSVKIATGIGSRSAFDVEEYLPNASILYYNSVPDAFAAVGTRMVDAFAFDKSILEYSFHNGDISGMKILDDTIGEGIDICFGISRKARIPDLKQKLDSFIEQILSDGTFDDMYDRWFRQNQLDLPSLPKADTPSGTLRVGTSGTALPYTFYANDSLTGFDIELIERFAYSANLKVEFSIYNYAGLITASEAGDIDCVSGNLSYTEERAQKIDFSIPYMINKTALLVRSADKEEENQSFWLSIRESFEKTFIREQRWKLIARGVLVTMEISILSALFGTILGFGICMLRRMKNPLAHSFAAVFIRIMQGTPIVVFLMILFYIVFAGSGISSIAVAVIGFSLNFAAYVSEMMRTGIDGVDIGQTEAALALGYTAPQAFFRIVMPQAARHFLPVYRGEFVSLVKSTSIVGYIAIQDLTKASDIIRSRTYEAFFPLIVTAVIYFIISGMLGWALSILDKRNQPNRVKRTVKGVNMQ